MAKTVDLKAAKEAKQKKIVIGGAVLLLVILGLTVPRTMKMMSHKAPTSAAGSQQSTQTTPTDTSTAAVPATPVPTATSGTPVSQVLSAPLEATAQNGQLARLSPTFKSKDPFVQQLNPDGSGDPSQSVVTTTTQAQATKKAATPTHTPSPAAPVKTPAQHPSTPAAPATPRPTPNPRSPSTAPTTPTAPPAAVPYLSAILSIDGVPEGVNVNADFPAASPVFHLVSATRRTAVITIAGGSLANGAPTLTLRLGKPVTLMNTADGTRYKLVLVSTSTAPAAPPTQAPSGASGAGATPATTQTTTGG